MSSEVSTDRIDQIYDLGLKAGALGGKLLGAGGGGFILFFVRPGQQAAVKTALKDLLSGLLTLSGGDRFDHAASAQGSFRRNVQIIYHSREPDDDEY